MCPVSIWVSCRSLLSPELAGHALLGVGVPGLRGVSAVMSAHAGASRYVIRVSSLIRAGVDIVLTPVTFIH